MYNEILPLVREKSAMRELVFSIPEMHNSVSELGGAGKSPEGPKGNENGSKTLQSQESSLTNTMVKDTITPTSTITSLCNMTSIVSLYLLLGYADSCSFQEA